MPELAPLVSITALLAFTTPGVGQQLHPLSTQIALGLARRSPPSAGASTTEGLQLVVRASRALTPRVGLVAEASVTRYGDESVFSALICPQGQICLDWPGQATGLAMAGLGAGLQPRINLGSLDFEVTATIGGYWLFRRATPLPAAAPGARATVGLGLPIGARTRVLLEAGALHLAAPGARDGNTRHIGIGVSFN